jgi:hypothetical protein
MMSRQGGQRAGFARRLAAPRASAQSPPLRLPLWGPRGRRVLGPSWARKGGAAKGWALVGRGPGSPVTTLRRPRAGAGQPGAWVGASQGAHPAPR